MPVFDNVFVDFFDYLEDLGVYEIVLPFLLIFVIIYGILQKVEIFGKTSNKIDPIIALVIAFFFVRVDFISDFLGVFLPKISIWLIILFSFLLLGGIFGLKSERYHGVVLFLVIFASILVVIWAVTTTAEQENLQQILPDWLVLDQDDWFAIFWILLLIALFIGIIGGGRSKKGDETKFERAIRAFGKEEEK